MAKEGSFDGFNEDGTPRFEEVVTQGEIDIEHVEIPKGVFFGKAGFQVVVNKEDKSLRCQEGSVPSGHKPTVSANWETAPPADPIQDLKNFQQGVQDMFSRDDALARRSSFRLIRGGLDTNDGFSRITKPGSGDPPVAS